MKKAALLILATVVFMSAGCARTIIMLDKADYHYKNGLRLLNRGNIEGAKTEFEYAILLDKGYAPAHMGLALTYGAMGDMEKAVEYMRKSIDLYRQPYKTIP